MASGRYELIDTSIQNGPGAVQLNMTDDDAAADNSKGFYEVSVPQLSDAPIKMWANDGAGTILSAQP
jgi:hypothetical protein